MKIRKIIGVCFYKLLGSWMPGKFGRFFRRICGKMIFDYCGRNVNICRKSVFSTRISIGDNSGIGERCYIQGKCFIGNNVMMGPQVNIWTKNHETSRTDIPMIKQGIREEEPVYIGDDVWIGNRVIILPGVRIGDGVVIGAGTVVPRDIPSFSVVVGNPARIVKKREEV